MQYLPFFILLLIAVLVPIWAIVKIIRLKYLFLQKIVSKKIMDRGLFSTIAIKEFTNYIFNQKKNIQKLLLKNILDDKFNLVCDNIQNPLIKAKFKLMVKGVISKIEYPDNLYNLMSSEFYIKNNQHIKAQNTLQKINKEKLNKPQKGLWFLQIAQIALFESDLLTASEFAAKALKIFQKKNFVFEEAQTYFVLGNIYRVCGVFDSADFMLRSALKLFKYLGAKNDEAEVLGTFALLMSIQKRFVEAENYLAKAEKIIPNKREIVGFIQCQKSMLAFIQDDIKSAEKLAKDILNKKYLPSVTAMANDILSRIAITKKMFNNAIKYANTASNIYLNEKNFASYFECQYIIAEAYVRNSDLDMAEIILRELINKEKHHKSCFYIANAYTLLGLVLLQKNEPNRAKAVFNQALNQELFNNRKTGAAIDYANLAIIEKKYGNIKNAHKNLTAALQYAKDVDDDLYNLIKSALD